GASVKRALLKLWPEDISDHARLRWIRMPMDTLDDNSFYHVHRLDQLSSCRDHRIGAKFKPEAGITSIPEDDSEHASSTSNLSAVSSIANSVYSALSEDWNRPLYFSKSKSRRYPLSLQNKIRALPQHVNVVVRQKCETLSQIKTRPQAARMAGQMRSRGLRDSSGDIIRPTIGDQLLDVEYRVVFKPIKRGRVFQEEGAPMSLFAHPCSTAVPRTFDTLGFIDYGQDHDADQGVDDALGGLERTAESSEANNISENSGERPVKDVNDTSAMVALGIEPLDPHPDPEAFYKTHFAHFREHGCFLEHDYVPTFPSEVEHASPIGVQDLSTCLHAHPLILNRTCSSRRVTSKSKVALKKVYSIVRRLWRGGRLSSSENRSRTNAVETRSVDPAMDRRVSTDWISKLPGGSRGRGQFDRDWLDATPAILDRELLDPAIYLAQKPIGRDPSIVA
ncbi:hypothetical protein BGX28_009425, partial [Mortierella sp. GBA30]